jgi:predicted solute-binding protein
VSDDRKTPPLRPGRILTVSGAIVPAVDTVVAVFTARKFRVTSAAGEFPIKLELGRWWADFLSPALPLPNAFLGLSKHGVVFIDSPTTNGSTASLMVRLYYADSAHQMRPIMFDAITDAIRVLTAAGVLVEAGPVIATKGRLL